jgi:hypothetical protein
MDNKKNEQNSKKTDLQNWLKLIKQIEQDSEKQLTSTQKKRIDKLGRFSRKHKDTFGREFTYLMLLESYKGRVKLRIPSQKGHGKNKEFNRFEKNFFDKAEKTLKELFHNKSVLTSVDCYVRVYCHRADMEKFWNDENHTLLFHHRPVGEFWGEEHIEVEFSDTIIERVVGVIFNFINSLSSAIKRNFGKIFKLEKQKYTEPTDESSMVAVKLKIPKNTPCVYYYGTLLLDIKSYKFVSKDTLFYGSEK